MPILRRGARTLSLAVTAVLAIGAGVGPVPAVSAVDAVPRANCQASQPSGSGALDDPYLIITATDLEFVRQTPDVWSSHFRQVADIDLAACGWPTGIGESGRPFTGTYDGAGFAIANLERVASGGLGSTGLFDFVSGADASLRSIHLIDAQVSGTTAGGLVGTASGRAEIKASSVSGSVVGRVAAGGLVGAFVSSGVVINSFSTADVSRQAGVVGAATGFGGLVGVAGPDSRLFNSYSIGTVSAAGVQAGPVVGSSQGAVTSVLWNPADSAVGTNGAGLQRTRAQMKEWVTFRSQNWHIFDGFSRAQPWSICPGMNSGYPFLSQRYLSDPCPSLTPSTSAVLARRGVAITPVTFAAERFTPNAFEVTAGALPDGLTLNSTTGQISGTPTTKAAKRSVEVTATRGRTSLTSVVVFTVKAKATTLEAQGCDVGGPGITVTCTEPGTYQISTPDGYRLASYTILGADGGQAAGWPNRDRGVGKFGFGAMVHNAGMPAVEVAPRYVVTVGKAPALKDGQMGNAVWFGSLDGGGYSALQVTGADQQPDALIAAAGGGGGGWEGFLSRYLTCLAPLRSAVGLTAPPWSPSCGAEPQMTDAERNAVVAVVMGTSVGPAASTYSVDPARVTAVLQQLFAQISTEFVPSAGLPVNVRRPSSAWAADASGGRGRGFILLGGFQLSGQAGAPGVTYVPEGAEVTTRPNTDKRRNGSVRLQFVPADAPAIDTAACDKATPALGQLVTCSQTGRASVTVPADAHVVVATVLGAGGGGGRTTITAGSTGQQLSGGSGAKVSATVEIRDLDSITATVGTTGAATWYTPNWTAYTWYGSGGGSSGLGAPDGEIWLSAGGGGGANGFNAAYTQVPQAYRLATETLVTGYVSGGAAPTPSGGVAWPVPSAAVGQGDHGGGQGTSWQVGARVTSAEFTAAGRSGGAVSFGANGLPLESPTAEGGVVTMKFCGLPDPPAVTSVTAGTSSGVASADVRAGAGDARGCAIDANQFRVAGSDAWVSAPGLSFPIQYLESGQALCVQMRAHNLAGWGRGGAYACGLARDVNADVQAGGTPSQATITVATGGAVTPTTVFVNVGETFVVRNFGTVATDAYLRPLTPDAATVRIGATTCVGDGGQVAANCFLNRSTDGGVTPGLTTFTVVSRGNVRIYTGSNGFNPANVAIS